MKKKEIRLVFIGDFGCGNKKNQKKKIFFFLFSQLKKKNNLFKGKTSILNRYIVISFLFFQFTFFYLIKQIQKNKKIKKNSLINFTKQQVILLRMMKMM